MNALVALDLVISLMVRAQQIADLIRQAQAQGRNLTDQELDAIVAENDAARARLAAAIARAREAP
jgi:RNA:NAD 2'-phosphotransferase (TPT1/KptA family)